MLFADVAERFGWGQVVPHIYLLVLQGKMRTNIQKKKPCNIDTSAVSKCKTKIPERASVVWVSVVEVKTTFDHPR